MRPVAAVHPQRKQRFCPSQILLFRVRFPCCATQCHQKPLAASSPCHSAWPTLLRAPPITTTNPTPHKGGGAKMKVEEDPCLCTWCTGACGIHFLNPGTCFSSLRPSGVSGEVSGPCRHGSRSVVELRYPCGCGRKGSKANRSMTLMPRGLEQAALPLMLSWLTANRSWSPVHRCWQEPAEQ